MAYLSDTPTLIPIFAASEFEDMLWPAQNVPSYYPVYLDPPFSLRSPGTEQTMPASLYGPSAAPTDWQDFNINQGYPATPGLPPACAQGLPLTNNWSASYIPDNSLLDWVESNAFEATLLVLAIVGIGGILAQKL